RLRGRRASNPRPAERARRATAKGPEQAGGPVQRDSPQATATVKARASAGSLNDEAVAEFARAGRFEETVVALAAMVRLPIEAAGRLMSSEPIDTVLIAAKAADLTWPTVKHLVTLRTSGRASPQHSEQAQ